MLIHFDVLFIHEREHRPELPVLPRPGDRQSLGVRGGTETMPVVGSRDEVVIRAQVFPLNVNVAANVEFGRSRSRSTG
ncbi:MAG: hypothetical protein ACRYGA_07930 [Janthinobacterium lividum]